MAASVQSMCQYWKNFDLQELQRDLDTTATELANRQDESDASRKRLVEQSRDFKKNTPEDIRKIVAPLLKSFQGEVDSLSKRGKASEAAFLSVYKRLIDLPDPVPVLEQALQTQKRAQRVADLEIENKQLRETLDDYNNEFAEVKNQEVTIKQLKEKLREYEEKLETTAEARAKEKERELQRLFSEKERQLQETQLSVARKLGEAEQRITSLQSALESAQSELFEVKSKYDEATAAKSDEMDMVMADLERANERAASSERETERLRQQLQTTAQSVEQADSMRQSASMEQALDILSRSSLQVELAAKEKEVAQLVEDVQRLQASLNKLRESTAAQVAKLEEELAAKNKAFRILEERLQSQEDYEEIKRELGVLKSIEFAGAYEDDEDKGRSRSLEVLLLEKNKTLQSENTQLKVASSDLTGPASAASGEPSSSASPEANSTNGDGATNSFAQIVGEELVQNYRPESSSQSTTPATSTVRSPPETPTSLTNHFLPPTSTSSSAAAAAAAAAAASVSAGVLDARHFPMPPPSPFYSYPGLATPFHPAFMPVNMVKSEMNTAGGLDTTYVAKNVRELLAVHNIGQRLFAKHVLGLSQGTVSELLSKPKSWDKLTEKGRESYRKMHAWATDDSNIMALKAISPKKGSQSIVANTSKDDTVTEDRIASILNEAQQAMQAKKAAEQQVASAVVSSIYHMEMSRMVAANPLLASLPHPQLSPALPSHSPHLPNHHAASANSSRKKQRELDRDQETQHSRSRSESGSDTGGENSQDMVARIYRQELEKLKQAADTAGNVAASSMYQQELDRLVQQKHMKHMHDLALAQHQRQQQLNGLSVKAEPPDSTSDETASQTACGPIDLSSKPQSSSTPSSSSSPTEATPSDTRHPSSAFYLVRPRVNGHDSGVESPQTPTPDNAPASTGSALPESLSPLQRMQNIANSLTSRPHLGMPSNKPLRSVLPPITQEQFDCFSNINTEELVKKVKETLSQYSISQRLFGESVLGLSQGSVSDLLARPKPWHMLTQKGREPFIRMQIFLSDTEAIPKLVSSQYRIPHEKLMRNSSRTEGGAHRRRKGSSDERGFDSPTQPKRPRVFFTEEQKDTLRAAYNQDPYPNQSTIENLASELGVGVKTVINWFHNHRMRAKQQHHSGTNSDGSSDQGNMAVKSEPGDENSNHSDVSNMSGDTVCREAVAAASAAALRQTETSQWMFPQFEPVALLQRKSGKECGTDWDLKDERLASEDRLDEPDGSVVIKSRTEPGTSLSSTGEQGGGPVPTMPVPTAGVNKRKRSNPQRVYEGTQLDRTHATSKLASSVEGISEEAVPASTADDTQDPSTSGLDTPVVNSSEEDKQDSADDAGRSEESGDIKMEREERVKKLQQGLQLSAGSWEDGDDSEESEHNSIEKMQRHTETSSNDGDWEF